MTTDAARQPDRKVTSPTTDTAAQIGLQVGDAIPATLACDVVIGTVADFVTALLGD